MTYDEVTSTTLADSGSIGALGGSGFEETTPKVRRAEMIVGMYIVLED